MQRHSVGSARLSRPRILFLALFAAFLFTSFLTSATAFSETITLAWDPNAESDVAGYKIYYGTESRDYGYVVDIGNQTSCTISGIVKGIMYYFAVTAYDSINNESDYSAEISFAVSTSASRMSMPWIPLLLLSR
jgi:hypothetical protein